MNKFVVIKDTREKNGWDFSIYDECRAMVSQGLKTGDYTLIGKEQTLTIERKATTGELALNLGKKKKQFEAELERMAQFKLAYLICEFSEETLMKFPAGSTIPKRRWRYLRMSGKFMRRKLYEYEEQYNVKIIFSKNKQSAEREAMKIFSSVTGG